MHEAVKGEDSSREQEVEIFYRFIGKIDLNESFSGEKLKIATALPSWGGFFPSEGKLHLLGNLSDKKILEIGRTTNLNKTFKHIHSYLKKDGLFIFGWSHPIHKCVSVENGQLIFSNSYFNEDWYCADMNNKEIMLSNRMLSTYINTLADKGFVIEKLVEETNREKAMTSNNDFGRKALMLPTVFVIRTRKNSNIRHD